MAEADWTELNDSLGAGSVRRGVTAGITPPDGGGSFVYGFNSVDTAIGAVGFFTNQVGFSPITKGVRIIGCMKRGTSGGATGFSPMLFASLDGLSVNDEGYLVGLGDGSPSRITLRKGSISGGLPDLDPGSSGVLARGTETFDVDEWVHLRLDVIANPSGDVRLQVYQNDLDANPLSGPPVWEAVPGLSEVIDDALGVNTGSVPFVGGYAGFAFRKSNVTRRAYFDHLEIFRQL